MNKKASMELGVNAIIVLIIALAILGLAMSFVTGLFKGGQKKLGGLIDRVDMPIHADSTNPIIFDSSEVFVKLSGTQQTSTLLVSVYNANFGDSNDIQLSITQCVDSYGSEETPFILSAPRQSIPPGSDAGYKAIISVLPGYTITTGTYICTVEARDLNTWTTVSQQLFITAVN